MGSPWRFSVPVLCFETVGVTLEVKCSCSLSAWKQLGSPWRLSVPVHCLLGNSWGHLGG